MYTHGEGVPENDAEALKWFRLAAYKGETDAQNLLGLMYGTGKGVPENYIQAYKWFNLAAAQGIEIAKKNKEIIAGRMLKAQIAEAQRLSAEWKPK